MSTLVRGLHHITLCPGGAQEDLDFFTTVLGQRLVKQTVLMDGSIPVYHLYYGNADADVGSIATTFPYSRRAGRPGSGQVSSTAYVIPKGTAEFWREHFDRHSVPHSGIYERFGARYIRVQHPAGLLFELVETPSDCRRPWTTSQIAEDTATRGFFGAVLSVRDVDVQEQFFVEALGFEKLGVDGAYHRLALPEAEPGCVIDLHHEPERAAGSWGFGAGTAHHLALNLETDDALVAQKALYEELGYTDASELKDRFYFHSMYVRSPGGILVECTSNVPGGFFQDESPEELGTTVHLPPWYEEHREIILSMLEPLTVPDEVRAAAARVLPVRSAAAVRQAQSGAEIRLSRTRAAFSRHKH